MRLLLLLLLSVVISSSSYGQGEELFLVAEKKEIGSYLEEERTIADSQFQILFHLDYGGVEIKNPENIASLYAGKIKEINLYYSDFPKGRDLTDLNKKRITAFANRIGLLDLDAASWSVIQQKDCSTIKEAKQLFHGFEILLDIPNEMNLTSIQIDTAFKDFVVEKVLKRNDWKEMLIVTDMTGSMSPYISQLFLWLKLNTIDERVKQFVFFNDGDTKRNKDKRIGDTGGVYQTKSKEYDEVEMVALQCMLSGNGGDQEENDIEGLLDGLKLCPDCLEQILIADNNSSVRDLKLMKKIEKPIRIIICGSDGKVNSEYLNLARSTGGSIHLMEEDLFNLIQLNEGESLEVQGVTYMIKGNKFVEIKKM